MFHRTSWLIMSRHFFYKICKGKIISVVGGFHSISGGSVRSLLFRMSNIMLDPSSFGQARDISMMTTYRLLCLSSVIMSFFHICTFTALFCTFLEYRTRQILSFTFQSKEKAIHFEWEMPLSTR